MSDDEGGGSGWLGFLAGALVVVLIGAAIYLYAGRSQPRAQLGLNAPSVKINSPDLPLPSPPPAPAAPPQANTGASASPPG